MKAKKRNAILTFVPLLLMLSFVSKQAESQETTTVPVAVGAVKAVRGCEIYVTGTAFGLGELIWIQKSVKGRMLRLGMAKIKRVDDTGGAFADVVQDQENCGAMEEAQVSFVRSRLATNTEPPVAPEDPLTAAAPRVTLPGRQQTVLGITHATHADRGLAQQNHVSPPFVNAWFTAHTSRWARVYETEVRGSFSRFLMGFEDTAGNLLHQDTLTDWDLGVTLRYLIGPLYAGTTNTGWWLSLAPQIQSSWRQVQVRGDNATSRSFSVGLLGAGGLMRVHFLPGFAGEGGVLWQIPYSARATGSWESLPPSGGGGRVAKGQIVFNLHEALTLGAGLCEEKYSSRNGTAPVNLRRLGTFLTAGWIWEP